MKRKPKITEVGNLSPLCSKAEIESTHDDFEQKQFKLVIVGDGAVGKTSICNRCVKDAFANHYKQTIGLDFYVKRLMLPTETGKLSIAFQLWDIGGQSIGSRMLSKYIHGANAILLCYDITNLQTFQNLTEWFDLVRKAFQNKSLPYIALIGNKTDMNHMRAVPPPKHYEFCDTNNAIGYFISARTGENVLPCFYRIAADLAGITLKKNQLQTLTKCLEASIVDYTQNNPYEKNVQDHVKDAQVKRKSRCNIM